MKRSGLKVGVRVGPKSPMWLWQSASGNTGAGDCAHATGKGAAQAAAQPNTLRREHPTNAQRLG